jgi:hypothetical protein
LLNKGDLVKHIVYLSQVGIVLDPGREHIIDYSTDVWVRVEWLTGERVRHFAHVKESILEKVT